MDNVPQDYDRSLGWKPIPTVMVWKIIKWHVSHHMPFSYNAILFQFIECDSFWLQREESHNVKVVYDIELGLWATKKEGWISCVFFFFFLLFNVCDRINWKCDLLCIGMIWAWSFKFHNMICRYKIHGRFYASLVVIYIGVCVFILESERTEGFDLFCIQIMC